MAGNVKGARGIFRHGGRGRLGCGWELGLSTQFPRPVKDLCYAANYPNA